MAGRTTPQANGTGDEARPERSKFTPDGPERIGVLGADLFGDSDTIAACDEFLLLDWKATPDDRWRSVLEFQRRHDAKLIQVGGLMPPNRESENAFETCQRLAKMACECSLPFPLTVESIDHRQPDLGPWLIKTPAQSGGLGIQWAGNKQLQAGQVYQQYLHGRRFGWVGLVNRKRAIALGLSRSLIHHDNDQPFLYRGSFGPVQCHGFPESACLALAMRAARAENDAGLINLDLIQDPHGKWWLLEINARPSASCEVIERAMHSTGMLATDESLMQYHLHPSMANELPRMIEATSRQPWLKLIIYATHAGCLNCRQADEALAKLQREAPCAIELALVDRPQPGQMTRRGEPLTTLLIGGLAEGHCHRMVRAAARTVLACVRPST